VRLKCNFNRNRLFLFHGFYPVRKVVGVILCEKWFSRPKFDPYDILWAARGQSRAARGAKPPLAGLDRADRAALGEAAPDSA
jgi:hypothetical protein